MTAVTVREEFLALRRTFIGGSDARTIMGDDEAALIRLWREKRGEIEPEDLSNNLIVQLGRVTEEAIICLLTGTENGTMVAAYSEEPIWRPSVRSPSTR